MKRTWVTWAVVAVLAAVAWTSLADVTSLVPTARELWTPTAAWAASPAAQSATMSPVSSRRRGVNQVVQVSGTELDAQFEQFSLSLPDDAPESFSEKVHVAPPAAQQAPTPAAEPPAVTATSPQRLQPSPDAAPLTESPTEPIEAESPRPAEIADRPTPTDAPSYESLAPREAAPVDEPVRRYARPAEPKTFAPPLEPTPAAQPLERDEPTPIASRSTEALSPRPFASQSHTSALFETPVQGSSPDVVSVNWVTPKEVNRGETITCDLQVTNGGDLPAVAVEVHVKLPENVNLAEADHTPEVDGRLLTWRVGRLEAHEMKSFRLGLQSQSEGDLAPMAAVTFTHAATAKIQVNDPQLKVVIEGPDETVVAQPATYHVHVSNPGTGHVRNVVLQTQIDGQLLHAQGPRTEYAVGTLGPGASRRLEVPLTALEAGNASIAILARATGNLQASDERALVAVRPTIEATLDGPTRRFVGRPATYTVTLHNPTPAAANNVQLFGGVPQGFRFVAASEGGSFDEAERLVAWFVGRLEPHETRQVSFDLETMTPGDHQVVAAVRADAGVEEQLVAQTQVEGLASVVLEVADVDDPVEASGQTAYHIRVSNQGSKAAENVQVAAIVPAEMEALRIGGPTEGTVSEDRIVFHPLARLAPGESQVFEVVVQCRQSGSARFRAFLRTNEQPEPIQQDEVTRVYQD